MLTPPFIYPRHNQPLPSPGDTVLSFLPVCLTPVSTVPCTPPPYQLSISPQYQQTLSWHPSLLLIDWLRLKGLMLLMDTLSCCLEKARFCKRDQSSYDMCVAVTIEYSTVGERVHTYSYRTTHVFQKEVAKPLSSTMQPWKDLKIKDIFFYWITSDMFPHHCITTHLRLSCNATDNMQSISTALCPCHRAQSGLSEWTSGALGFGPRGRW